MVPGFLITKLKSHLRVETPLAHGSGLGLWLAYWIVSSHDGSIDPEITEQGTTMTVTIPRKPDVTVQQQVTEVTRSRDKYKTSFGEASEGDGDSQRRWADY